MYTDPRFKRRSPLFFITRLSERGESYWHTEVRLSHFTSQSITGPLHYKWHSSYKSDIFLPALTFRIQTPARDFSPAISSSSSFVSFLKTQVSLIVVFFFFSPEAWLVQKQETDGWLFLEGYYRVSSSNKVFFHRILVSFNACVGNFIKLGPRTRKWPVTMRLQKKDF